MTNVMSSPTPCSDSGLPSEIWIDYSSINLEFLALKRAETEISSAVNKYEQSFKLQQPFKAPVEAAKLGAVEQHWAIQPTLFNFKIHTGLRRRTKLQMLC